MHSTPRKSRTSANAGQCLKTQPKEKSVRSFPPERSANRGDPVRTDVERDVRAHHRRERVVDGDVEEASHQGNRFIRRVVVRFVKADRDEVLLEHDATCRDVEVGCCVELIPELDALGR